MSKERLEKKRKNTASFVASLGAVAYSRDRPYNFSCLSAVPKNGRFRRFFFLRLWMSFGEEKPFVANDASF